MGVVGWDAVDCRSVGRSVGRTVTGACTGTLVHAYLIERAAIAPMRSLLLVRRRGGGAGRQGLRDWIGCPAASGASVDRSIACLYMRGFEGFSIDCVESKSAWGLRVYLCERRLVG